MPHNGLDTGKRPNKIHNTDIKLFLMCSKCCHPVELCGFSMGSASVWGYGSGISTRLSVTGGRAIIILPTKSNYFRMLWHCEH